MSGFLGSVGNLASAAEGVIGLVTNVITVTGKTAGASLLLDAILSENNVLTSEVTDYPIENGLAVNDAIIPQSERLTLDGVVTNASVTLFGSLFSGGQVGLSKLLAAQNMLRTVYKQRTPITLVTQLATYTNFAMTQCEMERRGEGAEGELHIRAEFKQINTVTLQTTTVNVANAAPSVAGKAGATRAAGGAVTNSSAAPVTSAPAATAASSLLSKLLGFGA